MAIGWSNLEIFGKNKILTTSFFWVAFVPIAAKALENTEKINIYTFEFSAQLPFSWHFFYAAALCIAFGKLLYNIYCPEIIKCYKTYSDFSNTGKGVYSLKLTLKNVLAKRPCDNETLFDEFKNFFCKNYVSDSDNVYYKIDSVIMENHCTGDSFFYLRDKSDKLNPIFLYVTLIFYMIGSILLLFVIIDNTFYVFDMFIDNIKQYPSASRLLTFISNAFSSNFYQL